MVFRFLPTFRQPILAGFVRELNKAIRAKKDAFKAVLLDRSSSDLQSWCTEAQKATILAIKISKKCCEDFGRRWIPLLFLAQKYFDRPSTVYEINDWVSFTPSKILQITFSWMKMKSFHDGGNTLMKFGFCKGINSWHTKKRKVRGRRWRLSWHTIGSEWSNTKADREVQVSWGCIHKWRNVRRRTIYPNWRS